MKTQSLKNQFNNDFIGIVENVNARNFSQTSTLFRTKATIANRVSWIVVI